MMKGNPKCLTMDNLNPAVKNVQYAVRGRVVIRANELEKEMKRDSVRNNRFQQLLFNSHLKSYLKKGQSKPFDKIIKANIGDCQATGQKPITFIRQVNYYIKKKENVNKIIHLKITALCALPELLNDDRFPSDVKHRVKRILGSCNGGSIGNTKNKNNKTKTLKLKI